MIYQLGDVDDAYGLDSDDPVSIPVRHQFTVLGIRTYRNQPQHRQFWDPVLRQVEDEIAGMLAVMRSGTVRGDELRGALSERSDRIHEIYQSNLDQLAKQQGKEGAKGATTCTVCSMFNVALQTDPQGGAIRYISGGRWSLYIYMTEVRGQKDYPQPEWLDVKSDSVSLTGINWFSVKWPNGAKALDRVNIESKKPLTFTPD